MPTDTNIPFNKRASDWLKKRISEREFCLRNKKGKVCDPCLEDNLNIIKSFIEKPDLSNQRIAAIFLHHSGKISNIVVGDNSYQQKIGELAYLVGEAKTILTREADETSVILNSKNN